MAKKLNDELRSKLTEYQNNYKLCNMNLVSCYSGLYPASLTKLSLVIFNQLISNKMYHKKDSKFFDPQEEKRIHTNVPVTPVTLLKNCHPVKYRLEGKSAQKDVGNIVKRINDLDDNNIFYVWRCGFPMNYMFVLERDIGSWKFYNPQGCITPKLIKKVLISTRGMTEAMHKMLQDSGDTTSLDDVRDSFCEFVSRLVGKMAPEVQVGLDRWDRGRGYREYLRSLNSKINELTPYQGLEPDEHFCDRLPLDVANKLKPKNKKVAAHKELDKDLAPKDSIVKPQTKAKKKKVPTKDKEAKYGTFAALHPLKDSRSFVQYYRRAIISQNDKAEFPPYESETQYAAEIIDKINESSYDENFLLAWVTFYLENHLKGNRVCKKDMTSLRSFKKTFEDYSERYIGCGV